MPRAASHRAKGGIGRAGAGRSGDVLFGSLFYFDVLLETLRFRHLAIRWLREVPGRDEPIEVLELVAAEELAEPESRGAGQSRSGMLRKLLLQRREPLEGQRVVQTVQRIERVLDSRVVRLAPEPLHDDER
jgi:hypothetical protein